MDKQKLDSLNSVNKNWSEVDEELKKVIKKEIKFIVCLFIKTKKYVKFNGITGGF